MDWDDDQQARLDALRAAELAGALGEAEQAELDALIALIETEEQERLGPAIAQMRSEQEALRRQVQESTLSNEQLAALAAQQEQWLADARLQLRELQRRHRALRETYQSITGKPLAAA